MCVGGQRHEPAALPPGNRPDNHCIGAVGGRGQDLYRGVRIRFPDSSSSSKSLYRLRHSEFAADMSV